MIKTLIITNCSSSKLTNDIDELQPIDFISEQTRRNKEEMLERKNPLLKQKALDMYTGRFYGKGEDDQFFKHGYRQLKERFNNANIDLYIVSAGYGLVNESDVIYPYNVTYDNSQFNRIKSLEINGERPFRRREDWGDHLKTREKLDMIFGDYDLILFFLSPNYLKAIHLENPQLQIRDNQRVIFFNKEEVLEGNNRCHTFITDERIRKSCKDYVYNGTNPKNFRGRVAYYLFNYVIAKWDKNDPFKVVYERYDKMERWLDLVVNKE